MDTRRKEIVSTNVYARVCQACGKTAEEAGLDVLVMCSRCKNAHLPAKGAHRFRQWAADPRQDWKTSTEWRTRHRDRCASMAVGAESRVTPPIDQLTADAERWMAEYIDRHFPRALIIALQDVIQQSGYPAVVESSGLFVRLNATLDPATSAPIYRFEKLSIGSRDESIFGGAAMARKTIDEVRAANRGIAAAVSYVVLRWDIAVEGRWEVGVQTTVGILHENVDRILANPPAQSSWIEEATRSVDGAWVRTTTPDGQPGHPRSWVSAAERVDSKWPRNIA